MIGKMVKEEVEDRDTIHGGENDAILHGGAEPLMMVDGSSLACQKLWTGNKLRSIHALTSSSTSSSSELPSTWALIAEPE